MVSKDQRCILFWGPGLKKNNRADNATPVSLRTRATQAMHRRSDNQNKNKDQTYAACLPKGWLKTSNDSGSISDAE